MIERQRGVEVITSTINHDCKEFQDIRIAFQELVVDVSDFDDPKAKAKNW